MTTTANVDGSVAPDFEEVRTEFKRNFSERHNTAARHPSRLPHDDPRAVHTGVDSARRPDASNPGAFFHDEIAVPLGLEFFIGLPREIPAERLATIKTLTPWRGLLALRYTPVAVTLKMIRPGSLLRRSFTGLSADPNDRRYLEVEVPAGNGVGTARAIARAYSCFAEGGADLGITPETFAQISAPPVVSRPMDEVLGPHGRFAPSSFSAARGSFATALIVSSARSSRPRAPSR